MSSFILRHKKKSIVAAIIIFVLIVTMTRNVSYEKLIGNLQRSGLKIRPVLGKELKVKREYFALGGSFIFLVIAKVMASNAHRDVYVNVFKGQPVEEAVQEAVSDMPKEQVGMVLDVNGVTVEITRFRSALIAKRLAMLHTEMSRKDRINADCDNSKYENRMTCSNLVYIPKKNFLLIISDIHRVIDVKNSKGERIARDYEPVPEEKLFAVIDALKNL